MRAKLLRWEQWPPRRWFVVDGLGAALSALLLGLLWAPNPTWVGLPPTELYFLALLALSFFGYDAVAWRAKPQHWRRYLLGCVAINTSYCLLTTALILYHWQSLTPLGWGYFGLEIGTILSLVVLEWRVANRASVGVGEDWE